MSGDATGKGSSDTLPRVEKGSERRRSDVTGNIPQWITSIFLGIIGVLILMVWNAMDNRVMVLEKKIEVMVSAQESKATQAATDIATLKVHSAVTDQVLAELRASQNQMVIQVTQAVTEMRSFVRSNK